MDFRPEYPSQTFSESNYDYFSDEDLELEVENRQWPKHQNYVEETVEHLKMKWNLLNILELINKLLKIL